MTQNEQTKQRMEEKQKQTYLQTKHTCYTTRDYGKNLGDSLLSIAQHHNLPLEDLLAANPEWDNPNHVFPAGTQVCVPVLAKPFLSLRPPRYHLVQAGDSFLGIAKKFDVPLKDLVSWNPQVVHGFLLPGERVILESLPKAT